MNSYAKWSHITDSDDEDELSSAQAQNQLFVSAAAGDVPALERCLRSGARVDALDESGSGALHRAAVNGHVGAVSRLLESRSNVNLADANGTTALSHASAVGSMAVVERLLEDVKADPNRANTEGVTPLMSASLHGSEPIVQRLLRRKADPKAADTDGGNALMRASARGHERVCELLLAHRAALDAQDAEGDSALHASSREGHLPIVKLLLRHGAAVGLADGNKETPLDLARAYGHDECAYALHAAELDAAESARHDVLDEKLRKQADDWRTGHAKKAELQQVAPPQPPAQKATHPATAAAAAAAVRGAPVATGEEVEAVEDDTHGGGAARAKEDQLLSDHGVKPIDVSGDGGVFKKLLRPATKPSELPPSKDVIVRCRFTISLLDVHEGDAAAIAAPPATTAEAAESLGAEAADPHVLTQRRQRVRALHLAAVASGRFGGGARKVERSAEPFSEVALGADKSVPRALHAALRTMGKGELACLLVRPDYAYGWDGDLGKAVPADAIASVLVEMIDWRWGRSAEEAIDLATSLKEGGGLAFRESRWEAAKECYAAAARLLADGGVSAPGGREEEVRELHLACVSNLAMCHMRLKQWQPAVEHATSVLRRDANNAKAYYRRATARTELGDVHAALEDFRQAVRLAPQDRAVRQAYAECKSAVAAADAREKVFGTQLEAALDGMAEESLQKAEPPDEEAAKQEAMSRAMNGGELPDMSAHYENERTIADARLDGNEGNLVLDPSTSLIKFKSMMDMGGTAGKYTWGQSERELLLLVPCAKGTKATHVTFEPTTHHLRLVVLGEVIIDSELHAPIVADDSTYQIEEAPPDGAGRSAGGSRLSVTLVKEKRTKAKDHWPGIVRGEQQLEVEALGNPIVAINENSKDDVSEYMRIMQGAEKGQLPGYA